MPTSTTENIPSHQSESTLLGLQPRETWEPSRLIGETWSDRIKEQSLFSARTTSRSYLDALRKKLAAIASRQIIPDVAEKALRSCLTDLGYRPETGFPDNDGIIPPARPGSITDLSSSRRISLIVDTNIKQARSMAQLASSENPVFLMTNPAWKLTRTGARKKPRGDWRERWKAAGNSVGWQGAAKSQMVALKTSPIWKALGDGAGGFTDTIASAFPPFAFGSGLAWVNVSRREWKRICEADGIDDGLTQIKEMAIAATQKKEAVKPIQKAAYRANVSSKESAYQELRRAMAEAQLAESEIKNGISRIEKARRERSADLAESYEASEAIKKSVAELEKARRDVSSVYAKMTAYADDIGKVQLPTDAKAQAVYDLKMQNLRDAAFRTCGIISTTRKSVAKRVTESVALLRSDIQED